MGRRKQQARAEVAAVQPEAPALIQANAGDMVPTRRSLRQQARQAVQTKYVNISSDEEEEEEVIESGSEEEEEDAEEEVEVESESDEEYTAPVAPSRNKRFLKDNRRGKGVENESESAAQVLSRLVGNRGGRGGARARGRGRPSNRGKNASGSRGRGRGGVGRMVEYEEEQEQVSELPLKVEITEGENLVMGLGSSGPSKRGRKRKVEYSGEQDHQTQPLNLTTSPVQQQHRKRGRQSAATEIVKPRFPFCSICLSKTPPNDYIINYMSCPNEYQRMKRLFAYVYKDMKFPFVPFDLERENVFDYCDLPLCDCCIQLYREMYDCYSQIETARDELKIRIERMVYQIQLSEKNPAVASQAGSIKGSSDSLMIKYSNFRRRFANYRPGESRTQIVENNSLVPAGIARIQIVNQVHKRTTGVQTFLSAGDFPATTPKLPVPVKVDTQPSKSSTNSTSGSTGSGSGTSLKTTAPIVSTFGSVPSTDTSVPAKTVIKTEPGTSPAVSTPSSTKIGTPTTTTSTKPPQSNSAVKSKPTSTPAKTVTPVPNRNQKQTPTTASDALIKRNPSSSVLTIVKTPGGKGPAIIRRLPENKPSSFSSAKVPQTNGVKKTNDSVPGPSGQKFTKTFLLVPKDEPCDVEAPTEEEEPDPFFNSGGDDDRGSASSATVNTNKSDSPKTANDDKRSAPSGSDADMDESQDADTNVFRKHKKLRVLPIQAYDKGSKENDKTDSNDSDIKEKDKVETEGTKEKEKSPAPTKSKSDEEPDKPSSDSDLPKSLNKDKEVEKEVNTSQEDAKAKGDSSKERSNENK